MHNHPSQDPTPSTEDILLTESVSKAGSLFEIAVLDHVIVTNSTFASVKALDVFNTKKFDREGVIK